MYGKSIQGSFYYNEYQLPDETYFERTRPTMLGSGLLPKQFWCIPPSAS